jgi:hypothetical protein
MNVIGRVASLAVPAVLMAGMLCSSSRAQGPATVVPIVADTAVPIIVNAVKPKPTGLAKFEGFVMNANSAQITVRAKGNDLGVQTFTLTQPASEKMQQVIDKGGFQYGDKVTVMYDPGSQKAFKVKGKPSRSL